jgi:hypothetical protein
LGGLLDSAENMIRGGFLSPARRAELMALLRNGHKEQRCGAAGARDAVA